MICKQKAESTFLTMNVLGCGTLWHANETLTRELTGLGGAKHCHTLLNKLDVLQNCIRDIDA